MLLIVINLFVHILLFTIYLSFLVIINSILSARDSWVGRGRGPWEIVLPPQLEKIIEETLEFMQYTGAKTEKLDQNITLRSWTCNLCSCNSQVGIMLIVNERA